MHRTQLPSKSHASGIQSSSKSVRVTGPFCHPSESSRRRNSVVIQIRCQSPAHSTPHDPSESSRHRIPFRVRTAVYHPSVNSSHPILPGHSWRPSLFSRHPSAWPAPSKVKVQPIRIHPSAWPASPTVRGPSTVIIQGHRIQPEPSTRSQASSNLNFKFTYHPSECDPVHSPVYHPSTSAAVLHRPASGPCSLIDAT